MMIENKQIKNVINQIQYATGNICFYIYYNIKFNSLSFKSAYLFLIKFY